MVVEEVMVEVEVGEGGGGPKDWGASTKSWEPLTPPELPPSSSLSLRFPVSCRASSSLDLFEGSGTRKDFQSRSHAGEDGWKRAKFGKKKKAGIASCRVPAPLINSPVDNAVIPFSVFMTRSGVVRSW